MTDKEDMMLERRLRACAVPPPGAEMEERIIRAAARLPQRRSVWSWLRALCEEFRLPAPAYSFASLLAAGFLAGFAAHPEVDAPVSGGALEQIYEDGGWL